MKPPFSDGFPMVFSQLQGAQPLVRPRPQALWPEEGSKGSAAEIKDAAKALQLAEAWHSSWVDVGEKMLLSSGQEMSGGSQKRSGRLGDPYSRNIFPMK